MFRKPYKKSIRYKFLKEIFLILFVGTLVLSTVIAVNEGKMLRQSLVTKGKSFASYIAMLSQEPLIMKDSIQLDSIVSEANKDEDIMYIVIHDAQGTLVTSQYASINYQSPRLKVILAGLSKESEVEDIIAAIRNKESNTELSIPILMGTYTIGKVTICMSQYNIQQQIVKTVLFVLVLNIMVAIVLGAVVFIVSRQIIFDPITELTRAIARLAKGDLSTRIAVKATGEVQMLLEGFNQMAGDLNKTTVSKDYLDNIIRSMINMLIVVSPDEKIIRTNDAACRLLGYEEEELIGRPAETIFGVESPRKDSWRKTLLADDRVGNIEESYREKNGREFPVLLSVSVMRGDNNLFRGTVYVAQDITERKRAEEALRQSEKELKEQAQELEKELIQRRRVEEELARSNKELGQLAYVASHDLQEPLRMVTSYVQLLARRYRGKLDGDADEFIAFAVNGAARMQQLINDLLTYSRVGTRGREFEPTDCEIILQQSLKNLQIAVEEKQAIVSHDPLPTVMADHVQLGQLFQNLIGNAIKFQGPEPPHVHVSESRNGNGWVFSVRDNGIGIAPEYAERIFGIFQRLHSLEKYPGTGIGLAVCKKIVEHHGGRIWVESKPGKGATFYFTLPGKGEQ